MHKHKSRLLYIDNIRWFIIIFIVIMHLNVTYSNIGLWYYKEPANTDIISTLLFRIYGSLNQAYFMGLLFFISGYFSARSSHKKGHKAFIKERLLRLGIPTLIYMIIIHPITMLIIDSFNNIKSKDFLSWYINYIISFRFLSCSGPLWFTLALLIFTFVYIIVERLFKKSTIDTKIRKLPIYLRNGKVFLLIVIIAFFLFLTRIFIPVGVLLFNTTPGNFIQLGYFPSYIILFLVGIITYKTSILSAIPYKLGMFWFKLGLFIGLPLWIILMFKTSKDTNLLFGGLTWQSVTYSTLESFFSIAISIGILVIFREKFNTQSNFVSFISKNAFGVYVFHPPILVAVTMYLSSVKLNPVVKMYSVTLIVLPTCFGFVYLLRKIPFLRKLFSLKI
ncbi:acyltransferase family protein [Clostridium sp. SHJSY1]|uniref:acyltransferase family protein n=1 Tax=Clostridium sp. SHJSY1 TaxID=2942483 RepID=UPI0028759C43|nr:acyltransferase family protein [Clostridium sp. SHJSY1]MDS0526752.1 acyltransferase family protein [Clostridium sp. SHJSY1]